MTSQLQKMRELWDALYVNAWDGDDECMSREIGATAGDDACCEIASTRAPALEGEYALRILAEEWAAQQKVLVEALEPRAA